MHGDEAYDRAQCIRASRIISTASRPARVELPAGPATIQAQSGFRRIARRGHARARARRIRGASRSRSRINDLPADFGRFLGADLHVHMNYGGHYRNTPATPARAAGGRGSRRRPQPDRQQGRAHPGHRLFPHRRRPGERPAHPAARAGVPHELLGTPRPAAPRAIITCCPTTRAIATPRSRAPGRTTARSPISRARRARWSATCTSPTSRSIRRRRRHFPTSCPPTSRTARWTTSRSWASPTTTSRRASGTAC